MTPVSESVVLLYGFPRNGPFHRIKYSYLGKHVSEAEPLSTQDVRTCACLALGMAAAIVTPLVSCVLAWRVSF